MARRRRTLSPLFSFSTFFLSDLACFQERTSFNFSKFAQSCRRRFTDPFFGVSLLASDADLLRALSLSSAVIVSYSFEPSDPKSNGVRLVLVASDLGSSQIWRAYAPITVILLFLVGRDPFSVYTRRPSSAPSSFSGSHLTIPQSQPSSAASNLGFLCRHPLPSHAAARRILGLQVLLGLLWGLQIMGRYLVLGLMGLLNQKPMFSSPQPISYNALFVRRSRLCLRSPIAFFNCFISHRIDSQAAFSVGWWFGPMTRRFHPRVKTYRNLETANFSLVHWSLAPTTPGLPCDLLQDVRSGFVGAKQQTGLPPTGVGSCRTPFPQIWTLAPTTPGLPCDLLQDVRSGFVGAKQQTGLPPTGVGSCRTPSPQIWISDPTSANPMPFVGRYPFSFPSSSFLKERAISHVSSSELVWSVYRCFCVARSSPVCEVCCSETSFSIIFKGSSSWCLVAFGIVAELMIVSSGLVVKAISNNRPLLVCIVSHGTFSPPASHVVKDRGLCDDFVCLRIGTVCLYLFIYCSYAFSLALVAALLLFLMVLNFMFVTNSSRVGE